MNNLVAVILSSCQLFMAPHTLSTTVWLGRNGKSPGFEERHECSADRVYIPFVWKTIAKRDLDRLIIKGRVEKTVLDNHPAFGNPEMPEPAMMYTNGLTIKYYGATTVTAGICAYTIISFWVNEGSEYYQEAGYEFLYIKDFGIIKCSFVATEVPSFEWDTFWLKDIRSTAQTSVIDKDILAIILKEL